MATRTNPLFEEYAPQKEVAEFLGKSERTLDNWASRRYGPPRINVNGAHFYRRDKLRAWLNSHENTAGQRGA